MDWGMAVIFSWLMLFTFIVTGCHASPDGRGSLLEFMKERLDLLEKNLQLRSTHAQVETLEKKLELYIVQNDRLFQENQALKQRVETLEEQLVSKVETLTTDVSDMQKEIDNCQTEIYKLIKQNSTDFVSYGNLFNTNPAEDQKVAISNQGVNSSIQKRIVPPTSEPRDQVAFYAYLSTNEPANLPRHHTLIFDTVVTNTGLGYHKGDGIFIVPTAGLYIFSWTVNIVGNGWASVELVVNTEVLGTVFANDFNCWDSGTGIAVAHVNVDDHVFLRMHENGRSVIQSGPRGRTSFSGWKLQ